ncbi:glycoprotein 3-alpha-L-fucosyltransferase A-like [Babylonia areolata]|uniref:glycoprotein 3-alpha-L-fucosyltransferase A-like n=1 Tax=Babylonia areolata TaxID=304850 RepID=UPI003FD49550
MRLSLRRVVQLCGGVAVLYFTYLFVHFPNLMSDTQFNSGGKDYPHHSGRNTPKVAAADNRSTVRLVSAMDVYPNRDNPSDDRILSQIMYIPRSVKNRTTNTLLKHKLLLFYGGDQHTEGSHYFKRRGCAVDACEMTNYENRLLEADVVVFNDQSLEAAQYLTRDPRQIYVMYLLESPSNSPFTGNLNGVMNWTATYRHQSTLVTPYEKYVPLNKSLLTRPPVRNYAAGKTKLVAWFVSNCYALNDRMEYVKELSRHIQVDIYGRCGPLRCPRGNKRCSTLLNQQYKFYLAFENSNCREYITEKFFITGLKHDVVPVVMGAAPGDYLRVAPPHSFIHVDDFKTPEQLAAFLHILDRDDTLYNTYFQWKGLWKNIDTLFPCRLCALAHDVEDRERSWFPDLNNWWRGPGICIHSGSRELSKLHDAGSSCVNDTDTCSQAENNKCDVNGVIYCCVNESRVIRAIYSDDGELSACVCEMPSPSNPGHRCTRRSDKSSAFSMMRMTTYSAHGAVFFRMAWVGVVSVVVGVLVV